MPLGAALSLSALSFTVISLPQRISTGSPALWALAPAWLVSVIFLMSAAFITSLFNVIRIWLLLDTKGPIKRLKRDYD